MSEPLSPPPASRRVWPWVLLILIGVVLLFPGACAAIFVAASIRQSPALFQDSLFVTLWLVSFAISAGGVALIWWAVQRLRRNLTAPP
jgi:hypothetical protein